MDEPEGWRTRRASNYRKLDEHVDDYIRLSQRLGQLYGREAEERSYDIHRKGYERHRDRLLEEEEAATQFAKRHRIDLDDVMVDTNGRFTIARGVREKRAADRLSHRKSFAERNKLPVVVGAAAAADASASGEPYEIVGVASLPKEPAAKIQSMKNYDEQYFNYPITGRADQRFISKNQSIVPGSRNGERTGTEIKVKAFEFRFRVRNYHESYVNRAAYSWAGWTGQAQTYRTEPAIAISQNAWESAFLDTAGQIPYFWNSVAGVPITVPPGGVGTMSMIAAGSNAGAPAVVPGGKTEFAAMRGPAAAAGVTLQGSIVAADAPYVPTAPSWTAPSHTTVNGTAAGNMCAVRIMVLWDRYGFDASDVTGLGYISWYDIMEDGISDWSPVWGLYSIPRLSRFEVLYDTVWEPESTNNEMICVCPPKELCGDYTTVYNKQSWNITTGTVLLGFATADNFVLSPPEPANFRVDGFFRLIYEDG